MSRASFPTKPQNIGGPLRLSGSRRQRAGTCITTVFRVLCELITIDKANSRFRGYGNRPCRHGRMRSRFSREAGGKIGEEIDRTPVSARE